MNDRIWVAGENCDLILKHPAHESLPLIGYRTPADSLGPRIRIHYEVYWPDESETQTEPIEIRHLWFTVLVADPMLCPDGSWYPYSSREVRSRLNAILLEKKNIRLTTSAGTITGLYGTDHVVIDTIYAGAHTLEIHLSTQVLSDLPAVPIDMWLDEVGVESSAWGVAIWRAE